MSHGGFADFIKLLTSTSNSYVDAKNKSYERRVADYLHARDQKKLDNERIANQHKIQAEIYADEEARNIKALEEGKKSGIYDAGAAQAADIARQKKEEHLKAIGDLSYSSEDYPKQENPNPLGWISDIGGALGIGGSRQPSQTKKPETATPTMPTNSMNPDQEFASRQNDMQTGKYSPTVLNGRAESPVMKTYRMQAEQQKNKMIGDRLRQQLASLEAAQLSLRSVRPESQQDLEDLSIQYDNNDKEIRRIDAQLAGLNLPDYVPSIDRNLTPSAYNNRLKSHITNINSEKSAKATSEAMRIIDDLEGELAKALNSNDPYIFQPLGRMATLAAISKEIIDPDHQAIFNARYDAFKQVLSASGYNGSGAMKLGPRKMIVDDLGHKWYVDENDNPSERVFPDQEKPSADDELTKQQKIRATDLKNKLLLEAWSDNDAIKWVDDKTGALKEPVMTDSYGMPLNIQNVIQEHERARQLFNQNYGQYGITIEENEFPFTGEFVKNLRKNSNFGGTQEGSNIAINKIPSAVRNTVNYLQRMNLSQDELQSAYDTGMLRGRKLKERERAAAAILVNNMDNPPTFTPNQEQPNATKSVDDLRMATDKAFRAGKDVVSILKSTKVKYPHLSEAIDRLIVTYSNMKKK